MIFEPFLSPIEEEPALICVEFFRDIDGAAEVVPKLVVVQGRRRSGQRVGIARPGIRVQGIVAKVVVSRAVELRRARPGDNADLGARGAAVFRRVIRSKNLDFLRRVDRKSTRLNSSHMSTSYAV